MPPSGWLPPLDHPFPTALSPTETGKACICGFLQCFDRADISFGQLHDELTTAALLVSACAVLHRTGPNANWAILVFRRSR